jgi:hypothetical protein
MPNSNPAVEKISTESDSWPGDYEGSHALPPPRIVRRENIKYFPYQPSDMDPMWDPSTASRRVEWLEDDHLEGGLFMLPGVAWLVK